jgi:hypothetical protein
MLVPDNLKVIIRKHRAKKLKSFRESTTRYLDRYVWLEDKTNILLLAPYDDTTGMRAWIGQGHKEQR